MLNARLATTLLALTLSTSVAAETIQQPVVYGNDDRVEPSDHLDENIRRLADDSIVALVQRNAIDSSNPNDVQIPATTLGSYQNLCPGERFADQPTSGFCSGTLIGPDLILTAGHCFPEGRSSCPDTSVVFNYQWVEGQGQETLTTNDVYHCERLVAHALSEFGGVTRDYGVFQLDRPVTGYTPANVFQGRPNLSDGDPFVLIGSPSGIPMKIDDGGTVRDPRADVGDYLVGDPDTFGGNSGSGVFLPDSLDLFAILISGETDYVNDGSCTRVNQCGQDTCNGEQMLYAAAAIEEFCQNGTDEALCGTASSCGDRYCAYDEDMSSCPDDCAVTAPASWTCSAAYYGAGDGCDCDCGSIDPDCSDPSQSVYNCGAGASCNADGTCDDDLLASLCDCAASPEQSKNAAMTLSLLIGLALLVRRRR